MSARSKWRDVDFDDAPPAPPPPLPVPVKTPRRDDFQHDTPVTLGAIGDIRGANVANVANVTGVVNAEKAETDPAPQSPDPAKSNIADAATIADHNTLERAAIIEEGAGVPREWAEGYARMLSMPCPSGFFPDQWQTVLDATGRFMDEWANKAAALGWTAAEVFGAYPLAPLADHSRRGLVFYLKPGERIAAISAEVAIFENARGVRQTRYRERIASGGVPAWNLQSNSTKSECP